MGQFDALVTGAGSPAGIGFEIARRLGLDGHRVAITATTGRIHERAAELRGYGLSVQGFVSDLTRLEAAFELMKSVGAVSILVNNAGMTSIGRPSVGKPLVDYQESDWDHAIDASLKTAFCATRAGIPAMIERRYGRVVNVASVTGPYVSGPNSAGYSAAKAGMVGLTRALAVELGDVGITVNAVAPGWIATGASSAFDLEAGRNTPVGRPGSTAEVAHVVAFLVSRAASYVNGETVVIDGGNLLQEAKMGSGRCLPAEG